jgi:acyl carrier protein
MSEQHIQTTVRAFIVESYLFGEDDPDLTEDTSLLESGVVDSTGILELVSFIESTYGFRLPDEDMLPENLDSIDRIAAYVSRRTGGK